MKPIVFFDIEASFSGKTVADIGAIDQKEATLHQASVQKFIEFAASSQFICGHNIIHHDLKILNRPELDALKPIDTLYLSPLLFPARPYHALLKDDKLQTDEFNNPLNDSIKARDLFFDEINAFTKLDKELKTIYYLLLRDKKEFRFFFEFLDFSTESQDLSSLIATFFNEKICTHSDLDVYIREYPTELAYCLALIQVNDRYSITPPWVFRNFPDTDRLMYLLRNRPCVNGCNYCDSFLDIHKALKKFFGYNSYRVFNGEPLQEKAVLAAVNQKSLLTVFPTGGGKSLTFQIPALMAGENTKGLTVVISPLQSLMKDQVDNLEKVGITEAVAINSLLDPIERGKAFERVLDGSVSLLYLSPESLRSRSIEKLMLDRKIERFVIDEAHCFSAWGQDFRVDYLYIGNFIQSLQEKKNLSEKIPVSCFTATAKQNVIQDIVSYFKEKLSLEMELYTTKASRVNLHYRVFNKETEEDKYLSLRGFITEKSCPIIIYVSRTRRARQLAERLEFDGFKARPYYGKMDAKEKTQNQEDFISGEIQIIVATSAFGMGVDKKDVGLVIHYDISDSLENYVQEAGRAGRDENIKADCYVLYNENDLSKHFILLNQTKLSIKEIQQIWRAVKKLTRHRANISNSALEIARTAGWDDNVVEIETRVRTAINALEESGYLLRGQNMPRIFANSILTKTAQEAIDKINHSGKFEEGQKIQAVRIIKKLFASKSRAKAGTEEAESRVDYISDSLGITRAGVIKIIQLLREVNILADTKDLTAFIQQDTKINKSLRIVDSFSKLERFLFSQIDPNQKVYNLKELNENAEGTQYINSNPNKINTLLHFWAVKNWAKKKKSQYSNNHFAIQYKLPREELESRMNRRQTLAKYLVEYLFEKSQNEENRNQSEILVEFSVQELKDAYESSHSLFKENISAEDIEDTLFYLSRIGAIKIEGGFLVIYNKLSIKRLELNNSIQYKIEDYEKLKHFYEHKIQQIHIVGEYANKMLENKDEALQYVEDYFHLNYSSFLNKYFKGERREHIKRNLTPAKFRQLFEGLSSQQLEIIKDNESKNIVVLAGPGSGKTKVLVHKLASLLLTEDVKYEQLLMLTFSRAAAVEFKKRLIELIGNAAHFIEIKTFHSYCFDLLGKVGNLEKSKSAVKSAVEKILNEEVEISRITKTVLVIDEAQDMDKDEFALIKALMSRNEELRVVAVGDDDQNIYTFRGSDSKYLGEILNEKNSVQYELPINFRSKKNIVDISNQLVLKIRNRLKSIPIIAKSKDNGKIKITEYQSANLIFPTVKEILSTELSGTTCVLTRTNEEAVQVTGLLIKHGQRARLIQSNDGFNIANLLEIRYFIEQLNLQDDIYTISKDSWDTAKRNLLSRYKQSEKIELCKKILQDFEDTNQVRKFKSDLMTHLNESKLEDLIKLDNETIFVSTMHKAKGKEFDNIFLTLDNYQSNTDEAMRLLYVAITRAKNNLNIHLNSDFLNNIYAENLKHVKDNNQYMPPNELAMQLGLKDIWLSSFTNSQNYMVGMKSGDRLLVDDYDCKNEKGAKLFRFSLNFQNRIKLLQSKGYILRNARVNFIVYWYSEDLDKELKVILPEVYFEKAER